MARKLSIQDLPLEGSTVLIRVDFNVPQEKNAMISDDSRIRAALPSIQYALDHQAAVVLLSHLGRPKGKRDASLSLAPCAKRLSELLGKPVLLAPDCVGPEVEQLVSGLHPGTVLLLENLRFHEAEEHPEKDPSFAEKLSRFGMFYINDAFGAAHRPHASIVPITQYFPGRAAQGMLMQKELSFLGDRLCRPARPFYTILGGAKVSTKIGLVKALIENVDGLFLGGAMAFTFLQAQGKKIGASPCENAFLSLATEVLNRCQERKVKLWLPIDVVIVDTISPTSTTHSHCVTMEEGIPEGYQGVDIGPMTIALFQKELKNAATVFWNGPLGIFEIPIYAKGTEAIAKTVAQLPAVTIVGGGDSIAALRKLGLTEQINHLSTGGGASLEFIEQGTLVGVEALSDKPIAVN